MNFHFWAEYRIHFTRIIHGIEDDNYYYYKLPRMEWKELSELYQDILLYSIEVDSVDCVQNTNLVSIHLLPVTTRSLDSRAVTAVVVVPSSLVRWSGNLGNRSYFTYFYKILEKWQPVKHDYVVYASRTATYLRRYVTAASIGTWKIIMIDYRFRKVSTWGRKCFAPVTVLTVSCLPAVTRTEIHW